MIAALRVRFRVPVPLEDRGIEESPAIAEPEKLEVFFDALAGIDFLLDSAGMKIPAFLRSLSKKLET